MFIGTVEDLIRTACSIGGSRHDSEDSFRFEETLSKLIHETSTVAVASLIKLDALSKSFLGICKELLDNPSTSASTRSRIHLALFNLCLHNVPIRRYLAGAEMQMCAPVYNCLQISLQEKLGPQNLIDILRLLQVLTYEKKYLTLGGWTNELINSFLLVEILRDDGAEWLPYCIAILSNLVCRSKTLCNKLKRSASYKPLCSRLLQLLSHNSRTVVVGSLMLIGHLDENTRDTVFGAQNISQTVTCIINIMTGGDSVMTTHIAIDLLRKLVVDESSEPPTLNASASELPKGSIFEKSIQSIARLTIALDSRMEECSKVYELLVAFCRVGGVLRSALCSAILKTPASERRLTTPCLVIARTASIPFEEVDPGLPLNALKLLIYLLTQLKDMKLQRDETTRQRDSLTTWESPQ